MVNSNIFDCNYQVLLLFIIVLKQNINCYINLANYEYLISLNSFWRLCCI